MRVFCTLFDSYYADRGLLLYESIKENCKNFRLYIFAFDDLVYSTFLKMKLKGVTVVPLKDFEDKQLLSAKKSRSKVEYMWTCSSSTILYVLEKFKEKECTYLDADTFFYSDPSKLVSEMGKSSILLTTHNYASQYDQSAVSGKYCVQFMTFKNEVKGMKALRWWRNACLDWCFAKPEEGKFGDQKYLDDWTERFEGVYVSQNIGAGVAPWNMQKFEAIGDNEIVEPTTGKKTKIVFFHFHALKIQGSNANLCPYRLPKSFKSFIYLPYLKQVLAARKRLNMVDSRFFGENFVPKMTLKTLIIDLIRYAKGELNIIDIGKLKV
ncbi:MAG: glycosyl transferase [archaeon]